MRPCNAALDCLGKKNGAPVSGALFLSLQGEGTPLPCNPTPGSSRSAITHLRSAAADRTRRSLGIDSLCGGKAPPAPPTGSGRLTVDRPSCAAPARSSSSLVPRLYLPPRLPRPPVVLSSHRATCGCSSVVERHVANVSVVDGSNPFTRSLNTDLLCGGRGPPAPPSGRDWLTVDRPSRTAPTRFVLVPRTSSLVPTARTACRVRPSCYPLIAIPAGVAQR